MTLIWTSEQEATSDEPVIGTEFHNEQNRAVLFTIENQEYVEFPLNREQLYQLTRAIGGVISEMEWHNATWIYAHGPISDDIYHLMKKGEHDKKGKTICGQKPRSLAFLGWDLSPVINEPWRTSSVCKRCLTKYDKIK